MPPKWESPIPVEPAEPVEFDGKRAIEKAVC